jgi:hypothetical protein
VRVIHQGRGGYIEIDGYHYPIELVHGGSFIVHFPAGHRHKALQAHLDAITALAVLRDPPWHIDNRSRLAPGISASPGEGA